MVGEMWHREKGGWLQTPPLGLPLYNVYDSPRGFQQKLSLLKVIRVHKPEDDDGNEVLEGWTAEVAESWGITDNVDAMFTELEDRNGVCVTADVTTCVAAGVAVESLVWIVALKNTVW